jgi:anti-sigma B factor antagonist
MIDKELTYTVADGVNDGTVILTLVGPFTLGNMFGFQDELRAMKPKCLILDMSQVPYMDSAGLGVVMNYYVSAAGAGRKLLLAGLNERLRALVEMTKVDTILTICDSVAAAEVHG